MTEAKTSFRKRFTLTGDFDTFGFQLIRIQESFPVEGSRLILSVLIILSIDLRTI